MTRIRLLSTLSLAVLAGIGLSGCGELPGMSMSSWQLTPSVNANNSVVTPDIVPITAQLILQQQQQAAIAQSLKIKNYIPPKGFTANIQSYQYLVGPQDVLSIYVWNYPTLNSPLQPTISSGGGIVNSNSQQVGISVDAEGNIYYPYVGYVHVAGQTPDQIRQLLTQKLAAIIKDPQIDVRVVGFESQTITVTGAVQKPIVVPVTEVPTTLLSAVTQAAPIPCSAVTVGPPPLCADLNDVVVTENGVQTTVNLNTLKTVNGESANWILTDGAQVFVPNDNEDTVFVLGAVTNPGPYSMIDGHMSLRDALGTAAGVTSLSAPSYTYVIRNYHDNPQVYVLDAASPDVFNLAGEFALEPQDVVFVSTSKFATFGEILSEVNQPLTTAVYVRSLTQ